MNNEPLLICDENIEWSKSLGDLLCNNHFEPIYVTSGKEVQQKLFDNKEITTLLLNWQTKEHGPLEVLRYIKSVSPSLRVFLIYDSELDFNDAALEKNDLFRMGVTECFIKPFSHQKITTALNGGQKFDTWKSKESSNVEREIQEITADDKEFTRIKLKKFAMGARTVFDHYIKLGKSKYLKILHRGDTFTIKRIEKYALNDVEFLYFKTSERSEYINYLNSLIKKTSLNSNLSAGTRLNLAQMGSELLVEEIYQQGLSPSLFKESKEMTEGVHATLKANPDIYQHIRNLISDDPSAYSKAYLTSLFSGMICMKIPWAGIRTASIVGQASFLLDLGLLKIPPTERNLDEAAMMPEEKMRYHSHPLLSLEMVEKYKFISESVREVIKDHHEYVNGEGFPRGVTGAHIFPLAKIVCFAGEFAEFITKNKVSPQVGIKRLLVKKKLLDRYDAEIVKCFVSSLMQKELLKKMS